MFIKKCSINIKCRYVLENIKIVYDIYNLIEVKPTQIL